MTKPTYMLHPVSVSERSIENAVNARVVSKTNSFNGKPYHAIVVDGDSPGFVEMTGGDEALAQRLLQPFCDALNAHDVDLFNRMQDDVGLRVYERKLDNGQ